MLQGKGERRMVAFRPAVQSLLIMLVDVAAKRTKLIDGHGVDHSSRVC